MRKLIDKLLFGVNVLAGLSLLIAYISPYASPTQFWFVSFFGLGYPFLLVVNALFVLYWLIRLKKQLLFSVVIIGVGYFHYGKFIRFKKQDPYPPIESIKIMSHNLRALGLNGPVFQTEDSKKIFEFLDQELFDVYCFQEFFDTKRKGFAPYDSIKRITGTRYRHVEYLAQFRENSFGIATLSQYPIIEKGIVPFEREGTNMCIFTDIDFNGKIVRVYNMHLQSLHFRRKDYEFLQSLDASNEEKIDGAKNIVSRFKSAFIKREEQAKIIRQHIEDCPFPVIVCGDFNDTPLSYSYDLIRGNLTDAFEAKGRGIGSTYNGMFPLLRIDYILHSPEIDNTYFNVVKEDLSDHYPLVAYFTFEQ
ncbi:MAG: hypothetical protein CL840_20235 [Crocinitomicaceae bacterium]|nr:hypothetical protein [Crocinitomicaceae bacterium]